jgi:hypothetical protein
LKTKSVRVIQESDAIRIYNKDNELLGEWHFRLDKTETMLLLEAIAFAEGVLDETPRINPFVPIHAPHRITLELSYFLTSNLKNAIAAALPCPGACHQDVHEAYHDGQGCKPRVKQ